MKNITNKWLEKEEQAYRSNKNLEVLRRAVNKNKISNAVIKQEELPSVAFKFSIDIPTMTATNQKQSGRCWIFAGLNVLREIIGKKYNIENFEFSQNYVAFYDKLEKINYAFEQIILLKDKPSDDRVLLWVLDNGICDGGQWDMLVNVIEKYGLVSKDAMPETFASSATSDVNYLTNCLIRKFNSEVRRAKSSAEITRLKDARLEDAYALLSTAFGVPPKTFDFEYVDKNKEYHLEKNVTPLDFYNKYVGGLLEEYISIINAPTKDKPFNKSYTVDHLNNVIGGKDIRYLNLKMEDFKKIVLKQMKDKEVVWFGSDCGKFGDREKGIWDNKLFAYDESFGINFTLNKSDALDSRMSAMNHAMVLTGVSLDEGKPTKWKIENSWGTDIANKGYFICSDSWFDEYVYQAVVNKKYLTKAQLEAFEKQPKHLNPWDPMGTLAD